MEGVGEQKEGEKAKSMRRKQGLPKKKKSRKKAQKNFWQDSLLDVWLTITDNNN